MGAQVSDDGKWYWDGHNWHPVPQVHLPEDPDAPFTPVEETEAAHPAVVSDPEGVDLGRRLIVDNAALRTTHTARDTAYALAGLFSVLVALVPGVLASVLKAPTRDLAAVIEAVTTTAVNEAVPMATIAVTSLLALTLLRGLLQVRLYTSPLLQSAAAVVAGTALVTVGGPYIGL